jgi:hypothetical protein
MYKSEVKRHKVSKIWKFPTGHASITPIAVITRAFSSLSDLVRLKRSNSLGYGYVFPEALQWGNAC